MTPERFRWATLRAGWPPEKAGVWASMPLGTESQALLARAAEIRVEELDGPRPTRWQLLMAWLYGKNADIRRSRRYWT